ncbi:MAG TPA: glycosyltransferase family 4 protein [Acidimicrobiales bacterium]|nr:glycosyltransferase family 4 protein [Acidimicrobiales bacterium]
MGRGADVVDVGVDLAQWERLLFAAAYTRRWSGRWRTAWNLSGGLETRARTEIERRARRLGADAVLQMMDVAGVRSLPYFVYHDMSLDLLLEFTDEHGLASAPNYPGVPRATLERLRRRQRRIFAAATGVIVMSRWVADHLVSVSGLDPARVHVVPPGVNVPLPPDLVEPRSAPRTRLLFVGRTLRGKGGDHVLGALRLLRLSQPGVTLTIVGPPDSALPDGIPEGVTYLGPTAPAQVSGLMANHDLLVMPSPFDAFGLVFAEALCHGLPSVALDRGAAPEILGGAGVLSPSSDREVLASVIGSALADDALYERCAAGQPEARRYYSWDRAARELGEIISRPPPDN